ncbi:MAG: amidohydrolase family protein [Candidatus Bathyarchaeia archaeon]
MATYDIALIDGMIIDGTGNPRFRGSLGIKDGKIVKLVKGHLPEQADREIVVNGLVVAPGIVDVHSHMDLYLIYDPLAQPLLRQGVTTTLYGNCGFTVAPMPKTSDDKLKFLRMLSNPAILGGYVKKVECDWDDLASYMKKIESNGIGINAAVLAGHSPVRIRVMGFDDALKRSATQAEVNEMAALIREELDCGAFGFSTSLLHKNVPSQFASMEEVTTLCKEAKGGCFQVVVRDLMEGFTSAIREVLAVAEASGTRLLVGELIEFLGKEHALKDALSAFIEAQAKGIDVHGLFEVYMKEFNLDCFTLFRFLPTWDAVASKGKEAIIQALADAEFRRQLYAELVSAKRSTIMQEWWGWNHLLVGEMNIQKYAALRELTVEDAAKTLRKEPMDFVCDLLIEDDLNSTFYQHGTKNASQDTIITLLQHPYTLIETDSGAHFEFKDPSLYGAFARVLGPLTRIASLSLEESVRKITSLPASKLGITDRGVIAEGWKADITVFDANTITDNIKFPNVDYAQGIHHVIVNGKIALENKTPTTELAGQVLRSRA